MVKSKVYQLLSEFSRLKWTVTIKGILVGLISGVLVSMYRFGIEFGTEKAIEVYGFLSVHPIYILPWLLLIALVSWVIYKMIRLEPYAKGSGIPQVEGIVLLGMKMKWYSILLVRFTAGLMASFFGVSLGREGPSIQIGACGAQAFAKATSNNKVEQNYLITAGAAAGLSAAFNAPLSGIMFTLEEVHRSFSSHILIAATTAALTADMVCSVFFGLSPVLDFLDVPQLPIHFYAWLVLLGVVSGLVGSLTNRCLLAVGPLYEKVPAAFRPAAALLVALPCGLFIPQVLGGGQNLIQLAEEAKFEIAMLAVFFIVKLLFTCISFGSGIPGGIFMPILAIGALCGSMLGKTAVNFGLSAEYIPVFCVCAMAGAMSSAVKAPITSILLMAEMTGSLVQLLPVALVAFLALFTSDLLKILPIYEVLLDRIADQGVKNESREKTGSLIEIPVELGSTVAGKKIKEVAWPKDMLVVGLRRGNQELVPNGNTQIMQGDYLVVLSSVRQYSEMNRLLGEMCLAK